MIRKIALITSIVLVWFSNRIGGEFMRIYYIPSRVKTYTPVTINDIEKRAFYRFEVPADLQLSIKLISILEQENYGDFNDKMVRIKIQREDKNYYIDSKGNVKGPIKISKGNMENIEKIINEMIVKYKIKKIKR